eukprot:4313409-Pyramimonas_sp.AAC.1
MADIDAEHVPPGKRRLPPRKEACVVLSPEVVVPPVLSRADVALAALARGGHVTHRAFPLSLASGAKGIVCAVCGAGGVTLQASFREACSQRPTAWGGRVLRCLAQGRYKMGRDWVPLIELWRPRDLVESGQALRPL